MEMSEKGILCLKLWEGFKKNVYKDCAGYPTVGVGHLLTDKEKETKIIQTADGPVDISKELTDKEVEQILKNDLHPAAATVTKAVKVNLAQYQFDALVSFCFNVGQGAFTQSTLLKLLNEGKYDEVPNQLRRWTKAGGKVSQGLVNRRENEIRLWTNQV